MQSAAVVDAMTRSHLGRNATAYGSVVDPIDGLVVFGGVAAESAPRSHNVDHGDPAMFTMMLCRGASGTEPCREYPNDVLVLEEKWGETDVLGVFKTWSGAAGGRGVGAPAAIVALAALAAAAAARP
jgi:hypothetical protein